MLTKDAAPLFVDYTITDKDAAGPFTATPADMTERAKLKSLDLNFDQITALGFHFHTSGAVISSIGKWLLSFSKDELNKKGSVYTVFMNTVEKLATKLANRVIGEKYASLFGHSCQ